MELDGVPIVGLPRRSPFGNLLRKAVSAAVLRVTTALEPVRSIARENALARTQQYSIGRQSSDAEEVPVLLLLVYRKSNSFLVEALLRNLSATADVRLWALDEIEPRLADMTLGSGPGTRFSHLNWLYLA